MSRCEELNALYVRMCKYLAEDSSVPMEDTFKTVVAFIALLATARDTHKTLVRAAPRALCVRARRHTGMWCDVRVRACVRAHATCRWPRPRRRRARRPKRRSRRRSAPPRRWRQPLGRPRRGAARAGTRRARAAARSLHLRRRAWRGVAALLPPGAARALLLLVLLRPAAPAACRLHDCCARVRLPHVFDLYSVPCVMWICLFFDCCSQHACLDLCCTHN
jgi:hypothetical protein